MKVRQAADLGEHRLREEIRDLKGQLKEALDQKYADATYQAFVGSALRSMPAMPPAWTMTRRGSARREVLPVVCFSDWHFDEVVRPEEVQFRNGYNRVIAGQRLKVFIEAVCRVLRDYVKGFTYPGLLMPWLGDNFSGDIHEELRITNADTLLSGVVHWMGPVAAGLRRLADEFGSVHIPVVVGNHGRNTLKPIAKRRAKSNFDWLFAHLVKLSLEQAGEKRITWTIPESQKVIVPAMDLKLLLSHGDEARGGSGIAGMLSPQLIQYARMKKTWIFDQWVLGHWHHLSAYRGIRVNGSGKGYDEFATICNFDFQRPCQDCFLVAPKSGVIASWPIFVDSEQEAWRKTAPPSAGRGEDGR